MPGPTSSTATGARSGERRRILVEVFNLQSIDRDGRISCACAEIPDGAYHPIDSMKAIGRAPVLVASAYVEAARPHQATRLPVRLPIVRIGVGS